MLEELFKERIAKIQEFQQSGLSCYKTRYERSHAIKDILYTFEPQAKVSCAGRIMALRAHGKSIFGDIKDSSGRMQFYCKKDTVGEAAFALIKKFDVGDIVGIQGELFKTHTNEPTILVLHMELLSKALRPLPEKWHGLKDVETRYRKRYLDLIVNDAVRAVFVARSAIVRSIRHYLDTRGYMEVETPMMHALAGGAAGKPFATHHEALNLELFLRIAPELYLKKLLVGDLEKVYELNRSFRNEGISTRHNPEFTMLEVYTAYADYRDVMTLTKGLITSVADEVFGKRTFQFNDQEIDLNVWEEVSFAEIMRQRFEIRPDDNEGQWVDKLRHHGVAVELKEGKISRTFILNLVADLLEIKSRHPVFVTDLYTELCPLAKRKPDNPLLSERFELFIGGMEVANAYSELNDPLEQRQRFAAQAKDDGALIDESFVEALEYAMPPAGGLGIGIDRLVMIMTGQSSIRDVVFFPQLKAEQDTGISVSDSATSS